MTHPTFLPAGISVLYEDKTHESHNENQEPKLKAGLSLRTPRRWRGQRLGVGLWRAQVLECAAPAALSLVSQSAISRPLVVRSFYSPGLIKMLKYRSTSPVKSGRITVVQSISVT